MQRKEIRAAGELVAGALAGGARYVQQMHEGIAGRSFDALGLMGAPVRAIHDRVAAGAYRGVARALAAPAQAGAGLLARRAPADAPALADSPGGSLALAALNGAIGDALARRRNALALSMTLRAGGHDVALDPAGLARAHPGATGRLVVFVHGLCETDDAWRLLPFVRDEPPRRSYGDRLRDDLGYTPLYVRYNTGLHISANGRELARLMETVVDGWPVAVEEIALVGHSMGGLVARSACHYGHAGDARWAAALRHVFCLGSPHLGAPLEKAANLAGHALARLPETRPTANVLNGRSVGIKDLRFGSCVEEDWCDCDPDEFLKDRCHEVPFLESAAYYFIGATLARDPDGLVSSLAGDLLVRFPSASGRGRGRRIPFEIDNGLHLAGANHFQLLNHPAVYEQLRAWLSRSRPAALPPAAATPG